MQCRNKVLFIQKMFVLSFLSSFLFTGYAFAADLENKENKNSDDNVAKPAVHSSGGVKTNSESKIKSIKTLESSKPIHVSKYKDLHVINWGYRGDGAPGNWGRLKSEYKLCRTGKFQSPVDLKPSFVADLPGLFFDYSEAPLEMMNNGHTIQVKAPKGSQLKVGEDVYNLLQYNFHTPSEHLINGKSFPMELQFVHAKKSGELGIVGIMVKEGKENKAIKGIWDNMPVKKSAFKKYDSISFNPAELLPGDLRYYRLMGSLTTPPCSEGVNWHIIKQPIEFSKGQIKKFKEVFNANSRPVQPLNSRMIISE